MEGPSGLSTAVTSSEERSGECALVGVVEGEATSDWLALRRGVERVTTLGDGLVGVTTMVLAFSIEALKDRRPAEVAWVS